MSTPGQRIREIMREERERTVDNITDLDASAQIREDVAKVFGAVQEAVNQLVGREDRTLDASVLPTALSLTIDEIQRVYRRLADEGLLSKTTPDAPSP